MLHRLPPMPLSAAAALAAVLLSIVPVSGAAAQDPEVLAQGKDDYAWHCMACHGEKGRGDGTMAPILTVPPTDLTAIAAAGSGRFPFWRVYDIIAGKQDVAGHQTFQMPDFWARYQRDEAKPGYLPAHIRILLLTHYVESLQEQ